MQLGIRILGIFSKIHFIQVRIDKKFVTCVVQPFLLRICEATGDLVFFYTLFVVFLRYDKTPKSVKDYLVFLKTVLIGFDTGMMR